MGITASPKKLTARAFDGVTLAGLPYGASAFNRLHEAFMRVDARDDVKVRHDHGVQHGVGRGRHADLECHKEQVAHTTDTESRHDAPPFISSSLRACRRSVGCLQPVKDVGLRDRLEACMCGPRSVQRTWATKRHGSDAEVQTH